MKLYFNEDKEFVNFLTEKLKIYNNAHSPFHKISREEGYVKHVNLKEEVDGRFMAGASARIYWGCMSIDKIFIEEGSRKSGIGSKLLQELIKIAKEKECKFIFLTTYSFQARNFYEKFGFYIIGELKDYPPGESFYTMRLDLV